jgi:hypothetical protein
VYAISRLRTSIVRSFRTMSRTVRANAMRQCRRAN